MDTTPDPQAESEDLVQILRTVSNKQVEIFDRLRHLEERVDRIMERLRKSEDRTAALEESLKTRPRRL